MAELFLTRGKDKNQARSLQGANHQIFGPLQGPCFIFQFTPGRLKLALLTTQGYSNSPPSGTL
jgi:hypothetical protein